MILGTNSTFQRDLRNMVPGIINIQSTLKGDGAAFDLLDMTRMYKDVDGKEPAGRIGDVVRRVNSYVEGIYLEYTEGDYATIASYNGVPVLYLDNTLFKIRGYNTKIPLPIVAHGTVNMSSGTLYWYNRAGSSYAPRKWGVIVRDGQYRTFHNDGNITVISVPEWNTYHDIYWNRPSAKITVDGDKRDFPSRSALENERYADDDTGFSLGTYTGATEDGVTGILTYFILTKDPLDEITLRTFADKHRERLGITRS